MLRSTLSLWREYLTPVRHESTFATSGEITPEEFVLAGDYLVHRFPTWQWAPAAEGKQRDFLPADKQVLMTKRVPLYVRAGAYVQDEADEGADEVDEDGWTATHPHKAGNGAPATAPVHEEIDDIDDLIDDEAEDTEAAAGVAVATGVSDVRQYDLFISYLTLYRVPKMYLLGYAGGVPLLPQQMFEDIVPDYRHKTVTIEKAPFLSNTTVVLIHPCKHATVMRVLMAHAAHAAETRFAARVAQLGLNDGSKTEEWEDVDVDAADGVRVDQYLVIFLKFISSVTPGIEHDYTMDAL